MAVSSTNFSTTADQTPDDPAADVLPEGDETFSPPGGPSTSNFTQSQTDKAGVYGEGEASAKGNFVDGTVYVYYNGSLVAERGLTSTLYSANGVPSEIEAGESTTDRTGTSEIRVETTTGGVSTQSFTGRGGELFINFGSVEVEVTDANGDPVNGATVEITDSGIAQTTGSDGKATFESSGTITLKTLSGSTEKDATIPAGGSTTASFQFAGLKGQVKSSETALPGVLVKVKDDNGDVIAQEKTDTRTGRFDFPEMPPDTSLTLASGQMSADAPTRGEGKYAQKNLDEGALNVPVAIVEFTLTDSETGDPVRNLVCKTDIVTTRSDAEGKVEAVVEADTDDEVELGLGKRYEPYVALYDLSEDEFKAETVDLDRASHSSSK